MFILEAEQENFPMEAFQPWYCQEYHEMLRWIYY